ncbi:MAG: hypothetical protein JRI25_25680 [Deltaproteobacteria bacterium]|nr:hypothetical protein [Deltaproteobacteria bacterium]
MRYLNLLCVLAMCGCHPQFATVDEACHDHVPGQARDTEEAVDAIYRVNCYRRVARMARGSTDYRISAAAEAHALYIEANGYSGDFITEEPGQPHFSGATPLDRAEAQNYDLGDGWDRWLGYWEGVFSRSEDPGEHADVWMESPYTRQGVLQPSWKDAGYGVSSSYAVLDILFDFPASTHIQNPVVYPADGQEDVPTEVLWWPDDQVVPLDRTVGFPVTVTVGSDMEGSGLYDDNPYGLVLLDSAIEGPDGEVSHYILIPESTPYSLLFTVALIPRDPLEPDTTYTVTARLHWNANAAKEVAATFTTLPAEASAARRVGPELIYAVYKPPGLDSRMVLFGDRSP